MILNKDKTIYEIIFTNKNLMLDAFFIVSSVILLAICANIRIPFWPVPVTLQTMGVFFIAFFLGSKRGFLSILAYILAGIIGFRVFTGFNSGTAALIGPTGGYLVGMIFMAYGVGFLVEKGMGRTNKNMIFCLLIGEIILYIFGLSWLYIYLGQPSIFSLLGMGLFPFIIGDIIKASIAAASFPYLYNGAEKLFDN